MAPPSSLKYPAFTEYNLIDCDPVFGTSNVLIFLRQVSEESKKEKVKSKKRERTTPALKR